MDDPLKEKFKAALLHCIRGATLFESRLDRKADPFEALKPCACGHTVQRRDQDHLEPFMREIQKQFEAAIPERVRMLTWAMMGHLAVCPIHRNRGLAKKAIFN